MDVHYARLITYHSLLRDRTTMTVTQLSICPTRACFEVLRYGCSVRADRYSSRLVSLAVCLVLCLPSPGCVRAFHERGQSAPVDAAAPEGDLLLADGRPLEGAAISEASPPPDSAVAVDAFVCPKACNKGCTGGVCKIECSVSFSCIGVVKCPPGIPCEVSCGLQACSVGGSTAAPPADARSPVQGCSPAPHPWSAARAAAR